MHVLREVDWKAFSILLVGALLGVVAVLPYMADLVRTLPAREEVMPEISMPLLVGLALLQNAILFSLAILVGLILSKRVGFRMPLIHAWATGTPVPDWNAAVVPGMLTGAAVGAVLVGIEVLFFLRDLPAPMLPLFEIPLWKRLLAGLLYGGITEEIFMRLFLLSLVTWLLGRWWRMPDGRPAPGVIRVAIVLVAVLFGLGHLPATAAMAPVTQMIVVRALVLNGVAGIAFGYLYWKRGLEAAMLGHMSAHLVMQIPGVMLIKTML